MKKPIYMILFFILFLSINIFSETKDLIIKFEEYEHQGEYEKAYNFLLSKYDEVSSDINICWRIAQMAFEIAENIDNRKEKIAYYDKGIDVTKYFIDKEIGNARERAECIHWYAINYSSKTKILGFFAGKEGFDLIKNVFYFIELMKKTDPTFPGSYLFSAKFLEAIPAFLGGDKLRMAIEYSEALRLSADKSYMITLFEFANSLHHRKWDKKRKERELLKNKFQSDGTPKDLDDIEYSRELLKMGVEYYNTLFNPSARERDTIVKIKDLQSKIEK